MNVLGLIFCNILWSGSYAASKHLMSRYHPLEVTFLRELFAVIPLLFIVLKGGRNSFVARWLANGISKTDIRLFMVGMLTFFVSPICQMTGLSMTRAIDSSLMIALEPLITILLAIVFLKEKLHYTQVISICLAIGGVFILSDSDIGKILAFTDTRLLGNLIFTIALFCEAAYSILAKPILHLREPEIFITVSLLVGVCALFFYNVIFDEAARLSGLIVLFQQSPALDWILFFGMVVGGTALGYLYWVKLMSGMPLSLMAITLYVQPVLGPIWGSVFLGEKISSSTFIGAVLIFAAVLLGTRKK